MLKPRARRLKGWAPNRMVPNVLTVMALCAGLTSVRFALEERWALAVLAIVAAGILDGLDGRAARLLKGTSRFGAELDSLSDFISFGAAPAVLIYEWSLVTWRGFGWTVALLYAVCCALRLARFNTEMDQPEEGRPPWTKTYFTGVPAPAAAGLVMLPVMFWLEFEGAFARAPALMTVVMVLVALGMISRLPTFSLKRYTVPHHYVLPVLLAVGLLVAALASEPWATLIAIDLLYLCSLPVAVLLQRVQSRGQPPVAENAARPTGEAGVVVAIPPRPSARG